MRGTRGVRGTSGSEGNKGEGGEREEEEHQSLHVSSLNSRHKMYLLGSILIGKIEHMVINCV